MDILYIVGKGSKWDNNELRYSLRSIAKYGQNVGRVFIAGYKPDFVSDEVIYIPCRDVSHAAHKNILCKTIHTINNSDIDKHFLISSDDHFYMRPVDFDNYPLYYRYKKIPATVEPCHLANPYFRSLLQTRQLLIRFRLTLYQTNPHVNTHFDADVYRKNKVIFDYGLKKLLFGGEMNCIMGNLLVREGWVPQAFDDKKLKHFESREDLIQQIGDVECISMYDSALECGIGDYLQECFPEKCRYEK